MKKLNYSVYLTWKNYEGKVVDKALIANFCSRERAYHYASTQNNDETDKSILYIVEEN